jgi:hypothetical protein
MIERNRAASGRVGNVVFGLACVGDGLVRVLSLGFLHTRLTLTVSKYQTKRHIMRLKSSRK